MTNVAEKYQTSPEVVRTMVGRRVAVVREGSRYVGTLKQATPSPAAGHALSLAIRTADATEYFALVPGTRVELTDDAPTTRRFVR